ncbi:MAG TPA: class I SAM-dependent methyltransferase [Nannocystaceae bacterium]|nr:class I SAM-dependent methyltransferase [Nannocystaceae bacterium]
MDARSSPESSRKEARDCPACGHDMPQWAFLAGGFPHVTCTECGTLFVSPLPSADVVQATYLRPDYHPSAESTCARMGAEAHGRATIVAELLERPAHGARVVEVGCGYGYFLDAVRELGMAAVGVDPAVTAARAAERGHTIHPVWLEAFGPDAPFDVLALFEVLEHLPDPHASLLRMREWLAPGAVLALSTPSYSGAPARVLGRKFPLVTPPDHLELFTRRGLAALLDRAGFEPLRWTSFSNLDGPAITRNLQRFALGESTPARAVATVFGRLGAAPVRLLDRLGLGTSFEVYARLRG